MGVINHSEKAAREFAAANGIAVGKIRKETYTHTDNFGTRELVRKSVTVGSMVVFHDGRGGAACWKIEGQERLVNNYLGYAIFEKFEQQKS